MDLKNKLKKGFKKIKPLLAARALKRKRGGETPGLKDYVKKSDGSDAFQKALENYKAKEKGAPIKIMSDREKEALRLRKGIYSKDNKTGKISLVSRNTGGEMLKNPGKADLDKDGKLSGYEKKRGMAIEKNMSGKRFGGVMKRSKGGGADTGKVGEMKSKIGVVSNKLKRLRRNLRGAASTKEVEFLRNLAPGEAARGIGTKLAEAIKKSKANKMGGGMMNKPMGYKKGTMIMARGCKLGRKKATKIT